MGATPICFQSVFLDSEGASALLLGGRTLYQPVFTLISSEGPGQGTQKTDKNGCSPLHIPSPWRKSSEAFSTKLKVTGSQMVPRKALFHGSADTSSAVCGACVAPASVQGPRRDVRVARKEAVVTGRSAGTGWRGVVVVLFMSRLPSRPSWEIKETDVFSLFPTKTSERTVCGSRLVSQISGKVFLFVSISPTSQVETLPHGGIAWGAYGRFCCLALGPHKLGSYLWR